MHRHDRANAHSSGGDVGDLDGVQSPWGLRLSAGLAILLMGLLSLFGSASAAPGEIGTWVSAGAPVQLEDGSTWFSDRDGAAVGVACVEGAEQVKVRGYFGDGEDVHGGWTAAKNVKIVGWMPRTCNAVDRVLW